MKVVLFCGGLGLRMREFSESIPKPMVPIGYRPILWHLMRYYAHYGHNDFILCLGYRGDVIKDYFMNYKEWLSNDFVLSGGGSQIELINRDIDDWRITFVDTGISANIGQRLMAVKPYLEGEQVFMANYADGLSDVPLSCLIDRFYDQGKIAMFLSVRPSQSFHVVSADEEGVVTRIQEANKTGMWINGGFFVFRKEIFDYIQPGEELVYEPFQRLIDRKELIAYSYDGFWTGVDTFKDRQWLDELYTQGGARWEVWKQQENP
jgi:glucose-1-phosphate cytidylyltransferase